MPDPRRIIERSDALARHSELPGGLTRVFLRFIENFRPHSRSTARA